MYMIFKKVEITFMIYHTVLHDKNYGMEGSTPSVRKYKMF
jgi:hypothetical protein